MKPLVIGDAVAALPVVQGGMGVGISLSGLAGAVAEAGGVGVISAAQTGYNRDGFASNPLKANLEALAYHIRAAKTKAKGGPVGVNIMVALSHYAEYVRCAVENGADLIISGAGLPTTLPALVAGSRVKIAPIVSSAKAATVLLNLWAKKYDRTADLVVLEGPKAGGHLGFSLEELAGEPDMDAVVRGVIAVAAQFEEKYGRAVPTVFGGGVYDRADTERYLALGCAGVQVATRFVATEECDAADAFKNAYLRARREDILVVKSPVGMPGRALNNPFLQNVARGNRYFEHCTRCIPSCKPADIPYCITQALVNSARGNVDEGLIFCGEIVHRVNEMTTVKDVLRELTE